MTFAVIVLAAGRGARMRSALPKMLHPIGGKPILAHILSSVSQLNPKKIVIIHGHQGDQLKNAFSKDEDLVWIEQKEQLGTGHATLQAMPSLTDVEKALILYGDIPLIQTETLKRLLQTASGDKIGLVTIEIDNPTGFGRIVRDRSGKIVRIVEEKDASIEEKQIKEINTGFFLVPKKYLQKWLPKISAQNAQQEYYLPDIVKMAVVEGIEVNSVCPQFLWEVLGVNDKVQLAELERLYQKRRALELMHSGATLLDPNRLDIRGEVIIGSDVTIDVNVVLEGQVILGNNVTIGPNVVIKDATIADDVHILANSVIENATVGVGCHIGPFARIRPGTELAENVRIGNFVEIKNANVGAKSKINHLSYVGDASIGQEVNMGAGTITCNFDGKNKHKTIIKDGVFIGSGTQLIAPVTVGEGASIGAGTTVTRDVPSHYLVHNRIEHRKVAKQADIDEKLN